VPTFDVDLDIEMEDLLHVLLDVDPLLPSVPVGVDLDIPSTSRPHASIRPRRSDSIITAVVEDLGESEPEIDDDAIASPSSSSASSSSSGDEFDDDHDDV